MRLPSVLMVSAVLGSVSAVAAPTHAMPTNLQKAADCMYNILKREPGFKDAKLGSYEGDGFSLPYLQYLSPPDGLGRRITVRFGAEVNCTAVKRTYNCCTDKSHICFLAVLNGLFAPSDSGPPDGDAQAIADKWNAECDVDALAIFV